MVNFGTCVLRVPEDLPYIKKHIISSPKTDKITPLFANISVLVGV